jgi:hypothetical protein
MKLTTSLIIDIMAKIKNTKPKGIIVVNLPTGDTSGIC